MATFSQSKGHTEKMSVGTTTFSAEEQLLNISVSDCNLQNQSPLFTTIPPEIRNQIFGLTLEEQDGKDAIAPQEYWYRPDYTHYRFIDTALLRTCRRIYLETRFIPPQNVTCRFWIGSQSRAAPLRECPAPSYIFRSFVSNRY
jgi:hypothetical protein